MVVFVHVLCFLYKKKPHKFYSRLLVNVQNPRNEDRLMTFVLIWKLFKNDLFYDKLQIICLHKHGNLQNFEFKNLFLITTIR